ncbi:RsmB/NOP family class I SAM-dependent RNA methyltransferase [Cohnella lubricantis]|uniref:RsmF rRNA methyltransferase first C-terminal domain-containing protein n=1 Tax=Cohnella lubricantis TaxID=2163172 RepID=A0A841TC11_9BACL|nr:RsmB/NOP family class I SAM-dependent RNA methyltransferase [Cohnella lubricantis]MBB6678834.1 RsmF rRNA methyltransferase first C-terminal domain-containing protein [Cohnella lubricantis]MBP2118264.1 NOL1/NOP2/sun family putative RNA methylase [Cohnella lubricantis]
MTSLPAAYVERIRRQLGSEADAMLASYEEPRTYGLRLNPLKLTPDEPLFARLTEHFQLKPIPWCGLGYFYEESARPGRHPWHAAGLYYIQEPSAMIAAELLDPQPGEIVLDLAAAPGGKTTQIASRMQGRGLLVANEIHTGRAKILAENVERLGIVNAVVTNAAPDELSARWSGAFDRIMLDAPCSGEGMFRKDPPSASEWSPEAIDACAARQRSILPDAAKLLKPGGRLVYSTCTFNRSENEETISWFLEAYPEFELLREERMWPHRGEGEGHYAAVLERRSSTPVAGNSQIAANEASGRVAAREISRREAELGSNELPAVAPQGKAVRRAARSGGKLDAAARGAADDGMRLLREFAETALPGFTLPADGEPLLFGEALYWLPAPEAGPISAAGLKGLKLPRPGLQLGNVRKGRFEPSHALARAVRPDMAALTCDYPPDSAEIAAYLRGESLPARHGADRGWGLVTVDGHPLGWIKANNGQYKNHFPKGLRLN